MFLFFFVVYFINTILAVGCVLTLPCTFSWEISFVPLALVPMLMVKSPESTYLAQVSVLCYKNSLCYSLDILWLLLRAVFPPLHCEPHLSTLYTKARGATFKASILTAVVIVLSLLL